MKKQFDKGSPEWQMMVDWWSCFQDFAIPEDKDEYWQELQRAQNELLSKYNRHPLIVNLSLATADYLVAIAEKRKI